MECSRCLICSQARVIHTGPRVWTGIIYLVLQLLSVFHFVYMQHAYDRVPGSTWEFPVQQEGKPPKAHFPEKYING